MKVRMVHDLGGPAWLAMGSLLLVTPGAPPLGEIRQALHSIRLDPPGAPQPPPRAHSKHIV